LARSLDQRAEGGAVPFEELDTPWWDEMPERAHTDYFAAAEKGLPVRHLSSAGEIGEAVALLATITSATGRSSRSTGARFIQP
jgi:hypothetical protein